MVVRVAAGGAAATISGQTITTTARLFSRCRRRSSSGRPGRLSSPSDLFQAPPTSVHAAAMKAVAAAAPLPTPCLAPAAAPAAAACCSSSFIVSLRL